jgi:hypothetical protein
MANFNLTEAAKAILTEGAKETFQSNITSKMSQRELTNPLKVGYSKLPSSVAYGTKEVGKIGDSPNDVNDKNPDYTRGVPKATPPGAKPPVGSEPMKKLAHQPGQDTAADSEGSPTDMGGHQGSESQYDAIRDRKPVKLAPQMMQKNPGANFDSYGEEFDQEDEDLIEEEKEKEEGAAHEKAEKKMMMKMKMKEKMKEDIDALLEGESLSEEFVSKATTIFEAAVIARAEEIIAEAEEELTEQFELAVEEVKNDLAEKLDDYINYMAEQWFEENQLAIETGLRSEIVEDFMTGLHNLFLEHYIDIPSDKVNVVEELTAKVEELEDSLNEQIKTAVEMKKELNEHKKLEAIYASCEGLTQTQVEKMKSLAEGIEFTTEEEFTDKLETLKESYFKSTIKSAESSDLNEEIIVEEEKKQRVSIDPSMEQYVQSISKTLVK